MVNWDPRSMTIIKFAEGKTFDQVLAAIPQEHKRWKCHTCHHIVDSNPCPVCNEKHIEEMCPIDHCNCSHEILDRIEYCPVCGKAVCPDCGTHDVVQISRVTGYLQDVSGFNAGKQQELKDRTRYSSDGAIAATSAKRNVLAEEPEIIPTVVQQSSGSVSAATPMPVIEVGH